MATVNTHHDNTLLLHAKSWKQRLGLGVVAWVALGVATALLDPRRDGADVISLCGGFGAWLATGVGIAAAYTVAHAAHRRAGAIAGFAAGALSLAVVGVVLSVVDWNAGVQGVLGVIFVSVIALLWARERGTSRRHRNAYSEEWRWGSQGPGWYHDDMLNWPDNPDDE